jgi:hypothetical protein
VNPFITIDLMVPLRAGIGTLWTGFPGDHRAGSLTPLFMVISISCSDKILKQRFLELKLDP